MHMRLFAGSPTAPDQEQRHHCEHELHDEPDQQNNPDGIQCLQNHGRCGELTYALRNSHVVLDCQWLGCAFAQPYSVSAR